MHLCRFLLLIIGEFFKRILGGEGRGNDVICVLLNVAWKQIPLKYCRLILFWKKSNIMGYLWNQCRITMVTERIHWTILHFLLFICFVRKSLMILNFSIFSCHVSVYMGIGSVARLLNPGTGLGGRLLVTDIHTSEHVFSCPYGYIRLGIFYLLFYHSSCKKYIPAGVHKVTLQRIS